MKNSKPETPKIDKEGILIIALLVLLLLLILVELVLVAINVVIAINTFGDNGDFMQYVYSALGFLLASFGTFYLVWAIGGRLDKGK